MAHAVLLTTLVRTTLRAQPRYRAILSQGGLRRRRADQPYVFARWKRCRVAPDYHVEIDGHWYSTPYRLIRKLVDVRIADNTVEIFHKGQRIASHACAPNRRGHRTVADHMAKAFEEQRRSPDLDALSFEERIGLLVDREAAEQDTKTAHHAPQIRPRCARAPVWKMSICAPHAVSTAPFSPGSSLATGSTAMRTCWSQAQPVWASSLACALGHKACRDNPSISIIASHVCSRHSPWRVTTDYGRLLKTLGRVQLLILGDWCLVRLKGETSWRSSTIAMARFHNRHKPSSRGTLA